MPQSLIRTFRLELLTISELLELTMLLLEKVFTPAKAQAVGLGKPYDELVALADRYAEILKRNPALIQTEPLTDYIAKLRLLFGLLDNSLRAARITNDSDQAEAVRVVSNVAAPYLKGKSRATIMALLGDARDLCDALGSAAYTQAVELLGLTGQVADIRELALKCDTLIDIRGEEKEYRKKIGTATAVRTALQKQLRFIFSGVLPVIYHSTDDTAVKNILVAMLDHTNATLDSFRYLTGGGTGDGTDDYGDPSKPDTQPADPPNGGTYIDPNA